VVLLGSIALFCSGVFGVYSEVGVFFCLVFTYCFLYVFVSVFFGGAVWRFRLFLLICYLVYSFAGLPFLFCLLWIICAVVLFLLLSTEGVFVGLGSLCGC